MGGETIPGAEASAGEVVHSCLLRVAFAPLDVQDLTAVYTSRGIYAVRRWLCTSTLCKCGVCVYGQTSAAEGARNRVE